MSIYHTTKYHTTKRKASKEEDTRAPEMQNQRSNKSAVESKVAVSTGICLLKSPHF
jgi:hypothetical protein